MAFRIDFLIIQVHIIPSLSPMRVIVIHHIRKKAMKMIKSSFIRKIRTFPTQMPFTNQRGSITTILEHLGHSDGRRIEIAPILVNGGTYDSGHSYHSRETPGQQCGTRRRRYR